MNCNNHHFTSMDTNSWSSSSHMDELNNALDPITILTDADLQNELDLYATTQFTFDGVSVMPIKDNPPIIDHCNQHLSSFYCPPNSVINTMNNNNDPCPSAISSPYDPQQQYLTPIPSLPTSPTLHDLGDHQQMNNPLLTLMLSPSSSSQYTLMQQQPSSDAHYMNRSASNDNTAILNDPHSAIPKEQSTSRRRHGSDTPSTTTTRGRSRRQQQQDRSSVLIPTSETAQPTQQQAGDYGNSSMGVVQTEPEEGNTSGCGDDVTPVRLSKRQRNTAASARFRIKKKMREQCLQRTACEMTNKANFMENKVHELEREIKWLKALLVAKNGCGYC